MNALVKFQFRLRSTPFPFALKNVRVVFYVSPRCRFVAFAFLFVAFAFRFVAFVFRCVAFRGVCVQSHLCMTFLRLLLSLTAERKCTVCML